MLIALDYDKTYTADPGLWDEFIASCASRGHEVNIVTMRFPSEPIEGLSIPVIYTSRKAKYGAIPAAIWIDDTPQWLFQDAL